LLDRSQQCARDTGPAMPRFDPEVLDIGRSKVRRALGIVAHPGIDHADRLAAIGECKEADVGLGQAGKGSDLALELLSAWPA
jgi:hypothetical protein